MPRPDTRRFAHPFRISCVLSMTNFLQVNWYPPFKKHGQEADTFSRDPICVYRPCLKTSESNTWGVLERVSLGGPSLPGTYDIGLTLTLIFLPPHLPCAGPMLPCLALPINLKSGIPFHAEDWALWGSRFTTGLPGSGWLTSLTHMLWHIWVLSCGADTLK